MPQFYLIPKRLARKAPMLFSMAQWVEAQLFRGIFWLVRRLSVENANRMAAIAFGLFGSFSDKAKKAQDNLAIAFPDSTEKWRKDTTRDIFRSLGSSTAELIKLEDIWAQREQRLEYVVDPLAEDYLQNKRAAIYVTAHIGPWQVAPLITKHYGLTINTLYAPESNPVLAELMLELRNFFGDHLIATDAGPRPWLKELRAGHIINMAMDTRPESGKLMPFFGRDALMNTSPAGIALRAGVPLIPARAERLPRGRYRITVYQPLFSPDPELPLKEQAAAMTQLVYGYFEDWIREYPGQWICLKRRWPKAHKL